MGSPFAFAKTPEEDDQLFAQLRQQEAQRAQWQASATPAQSQQIGAFYQRVPYADPGVALAVGTGAAQGTVDPAAAADAVDQATASGQRPAWQTMGAMDKAITPGMTPEQIHTLNPDVPVPSKGFDWTNPTDYIGAYANASKGIVREMGAVAQSSWEEVQNRIAAAQQVATTGDFGDVRNFILPNPFEEKGRQAIGNAVESLQATNVGSQLSQARSSGSVDLGSGFFPGGTVTHSEQPTRAREVRGTIDYTVPGPDGKPVVDPTTGQAQVFHQTRTIGRSVAAIVTQPGSKNYSVMSGAIDAATQWALDPTLALMEGSSVPERIFEAAPKLAEEAPEVQKALTSGVAEKSTKALMTAALNSPTGRSVIADLKNSTTREQVRQIVGNGFTADQLDRIASTSDWGQIRGILRGAANSNTEFREGFTALAGDGEKVPALVGSDAAAHVADVASPEGVQAAAKNLLIDAERKTVNPVNVDQFLESDQTQGWLRSLAETNDPLVVKANLGKGATVDLIHNVTKAADIDEVKGALRDELGISVRAPTDLPGLNNGFQIKHQILSHLPGFDESGTLAASGLTKVPDKYLAGFRWDATGLQKTNSLNAVDDFMKTYGVSYADRSQIYGEMAESLSTGTGKVSALEHFSDAMEKVWLAQGVPEDFAKTQATLFKDRAVSLYGIDAQGREYDGGFMALAGKQQDLTMVSPSKLTEAMNSGIELPDSRQMRRVSSRFGRLISDMSDVNNPGAKLKFPLSAGQSFFEDVWPKMQIARVATALRVTMDEQLRLAAAGLPNAISHPFQWMSLVAGSSADLERLGIDSTSAQKMLDEVGASIYTGDSPDRTLRAMRSTGAWTDVPFKPGQGFQESRAMEGGLSMAQQFAGDPISRMVAQGKTSDEIMTWLHSSEGEEAFKGYAQLGKDAVSRDATTGMKIRTPVDLTDDSILRGWIDKNIRGQVENFVGENTDLRNAIGNNTVPLSGEAAEAGETPGVAFQDGQATPDMERIMRDHMEQPTAPDKVKWNPSVADRPDGKTIQQQWSKVSGWVFGQLFNKPIGQFTRSPVYRDALFQRLAEIAPHLEPDEANKLLKTIEATASEQGFVGKVAEFAGGTKPLDALIDAAGDAHGSLTLDDAINYAHGHALDTVHDLLFNAAQKTNLEQSLRAIMPFATAWREVLTNWGKILVDRPQNLRKFQMIVDGARDSGFFYTDPVTGKEMFNYPGSDWLVKQFGSGILGKAVGMSPLGGALGFGAGSPPGPDPLRGEVQGLNIVSGSFLPGFGPVIQIPAAELLKDKPQADWVRGIISPYGVSTQDNAPFFGLAGDYLLPGWAQKVISAVTTSPDSTSAYGNTYAQVVQQLASSGKYGTGPDDRARMLNDAKNQAKMLTVLRGLGQFTAPASPSYAPEIATKEGDVLMAKLSADAHDMQVQDPQNWVRDFMSVYGEKPLAAVQSKTRSALGGLDASKEFGNWERDHGSALSAEPAVAGYFANIGSDFDFEVYNRQLASGERQKQTGQQLADAADVTVARWKYDQMRQMLGTNPTSAQLDWLAQQKVALQQKYPGYATTASTATDFDTKINQLKRAVTDPSLKGDVQTAVATYLTLRDQAVAVAQQRAGNDRAGLTGAHDADLRAWLAGMATKIEARYPNFSRIYDGILDSEVSQ